MTYTIRPMNRSHCGSAAPTTSRISCRPVRSDLDRVPKRPRRCLQMFCKFLLRTYAQMSLTPRGSRLHDDEQITRAIKAAHIVLLGMVALRHHPKPTFRHAPCKSLKVFVGLITFLICDGRIPGFLRGTS